MKVRQANRLLVEFIKVRCPQYWVAKARQIAVALVIRNDDDHVCAIFGSRHVSCSKANQEKLGTHIFSQLSVIQLGSFVAMRCELGVRGFHPSQQVAE